MGQRGRRALLSFAGLVVSVAAGAQSASGVSAAST